MITTAELSDLLLIAVFERKNAHRQAQEIAARLDGEAREIACVLLGEKVPLNSSAAAIADQVRHSAARHSHAVASA